MRAAACLRSSPTGPACLTTFRRLLLTPLSRAPDELPPKTTVGPDANGNIVTTEYYIDDDGKKVKVGIHRALRCPRGPSLHTACLTPAAARVVCLCVSQLVRTIRLKKVQQTVNKEVAKRKVPLPRAPAMAAPRFPTRQPSDALAFVPLRVPCGRCSAQHWVKFGDAKGIKPGPDPATTNVGENMILKLSVKVNTVWHLPPRPAASGGRSVVPSNRARCLHASFGSRRPGRGRRGAVVDL